MRVTIDIDNKSKGDLYKAIIRGYRYLRRKKPDFIRETGRGYHLIWRGLSITEREMLKFRLLIGDDPNRVRLDSLSPHRIKQVLFYKKGVRFKNG